MFGLFLILPVLAIYSEQLEGATPVLMGIALGIYGITQAMFQIPFGILSDKYGRKPIIILGLMIFIVGSLVAALASSIEGVIIGRALQGAGAIAAVVLALTSDLTREEQRTKAMALIGMTIGLAFMFALVVSPWLAFFIGVKGMFVLTAVLAVGAIVVIIKAVPTPVQRRNLEVRAVPAKMLELLRNPQLIRLDIGIFVLHFVLTAMFVVVPIILLERLSLPTRDHWQVYLPALIASIVFMVPMIILSAKKAWLMRIFFAAICILLFAQCLLMWRPLGVLGMTVCLFFFFWGFNLLEAMLPSIVSRVAPAAGKGSAMGVYNTFQFMGVFFGGFLGGLIYGAVGVTAVFVLCGLVLLAWAWIVFKAPQPTLLDSLVVRYQGNVSQADFEAVNGVEEAIIIDGESTAYLKVDKQLLDHAALSALTN
ncbi:putative MFS family arabinose efflux permease [Arenicella xantha]|uniref:Putative MFS family arabinose efflux permease n=2 Tax=Arenicella xantha TaxID=644221 RepID=A0A395JHN8_9GAMM|nr:putative MFS family arabinose efflux permease [Arenicella xantha]